MPHTVIAQLVVWLAAIAALLGAAGLLTKRHWFGGWLRGSSAMVLLVAAFICAALALDLRSYQLWPHAQQSIATISFEELDEQTYIARLKRPGGAEQEFELHGDQWQVDVRILNWTRALRNLGLKPVYRLERLSGRFLVLEQELKLQPRSYSLARNLTGPDGADLVRRVHDALPWFNAEASTAAYMPMTADAEYSLQLTAIGLTAQAQNAAAKQALAVW